MRPLLGLLLLGAAAVIALLAALFNVISQQPY